MAGEPKPMGRKAEAEDRRSAGRGLGRLVCVKRSRAREKAGQNMRTTLEEMESRRNRFQRKAEAKETAKSFTYLMRET